MITPPSTETNASENSAVMRRHSGIRILVGERSPRVAGERSTGAVNGFLHTFGERP